MSTTYTAIIQRDGKWWIGWVQEIPGVNSQAKTRAVLLENLRSALGEALAMNRTDAVQSAVGEYEEVTVAV